MSNFKLIKNGYHLTFISSDNNMLTKDFSNDKETLLLIMECDNEDSILHYFNPKLREQQLRYDVQQSFLEKVKNSTYLALEGIVITIPSISNMSLPENLATKILEAEENGDERLLSSYLNFWRLCVLNPSEITRQNLFWFLEKNGMTITESGLFVAYRNVIVKDKRFTNLEFCKVVTDNYLKVKNWKKSPSKYNLWYNIDTEEYSIHLSHIELEDKICYEYEDEEDDIYEEECENVWENKGNLEDLYKDLKDFQSTNYIEFTDEYSKTTSIIIGRPVSIPRSKCDDDNKTTCSKGLHVASKDWLTHNYFGDVGIICLVNPRNVVAVPIENQEYGKMRCCEYLPIGFSQRDDKGNLKDSIESGFEDGVEVDYTGVEGRDSNFVLNLVGEATKFAVNLNEVLELYKNYKNKNL